MKDFREMKRRGEKISALTANHYPTARLLDESGIDIILVGDSVGMVVLGYPDTTDVTLDEMLHHTRAAARGVKQALLVADMPIHTYDTPAQAAETARKFVDAGAQAVKLEGGMSHVAQIEAITQAGIRFMGARRHAYRKVCASKAATESRAVRNWKSTHCWWMHVRWKTREHFPWCLRLSWPMSPSRSLMRLVSRQSGSARASIATDKFW